MRRFAAGLCALVRGRGLASLGSTGVHGSFPHTAKASWIESCTAQGYQEQRRAFCSEKPNRDAVEVDLSRLEGEDHGRCATVTAHVAYTRSPVLTPLFTALGSQPIYSVD